MTPLELLNKVYETEGVVLTIPLNYYTKLRRLVSNTKSRMAKQLGDLADPRSLQYTVLETTEETVKVSITLTDGTELPIISMEELSNEF